MGDRRRFPPPRRTVAGRALLLVALAALVAWQYFFSDQPAVRPALEPGTTAQVLRAVDGDTLLLADHTRVRLLGVDTPETKRPDWPVEPFGPEAHEFTRAHVEGRAVRLEFDAERHDKYDRLLAYVYLDDWLLNEELIRAGLGRAITNHPYSEAMKRRFRAAEHEAKEAQRGIWSTADGRQRDRGHKKQGGTWPNRSVGKPQL
jgi:micrococcal nuclease